MDCYNSLHRCGKAMEARISERLKTGVQEACEHTLAHHPNFTVQALIVVSLKDGSTVLVTIKETINLTNTTTIYSDQNSEQSEVEQSLSTLLPTLCRDELSDNVEFSVDALVAITLDRHRIIVVSVQENVGGHLKTARKDEQKKIERKCENLSKTIKISTGGSLESKSCLVCGDLSLIRAFGVNACEACRVFFKRILRAGVDYVPCATPCVITFDSRRCKGCRLKKCRDVGMKSDESWTPVIKQEKEKDVSPKPSQKQDITKPTDRVPKQEPLQEVKYLDEADIKSGLYDCVAPDVDGYGGNDVTQDDDVTNDNDVTRNDDITHDDDDINDNDVTLGDDVTFDVSSDTDEYDVDATIVQSNIKKQQEKIDCEKNKPITRARVKLRKTRKTTKSNYKKKHPRPISCNECDFTCTSLNHLKLHTEKEHSEVPPPKDPQKPISCDECDYVCKSMTALNAHRIKIHGEKPKEKPTVYHECTLCEFTTATAYRLKRHTRQVHENPKKKVKKDPDAELEKRKARKPTVRKICDHCGYSTLYSTNFQRHLIAKHPDQFDESRVKKYRCPECPDRKLSDSSQLKAHIRNYHNTSLICPCHGRKFVTAFGMKQHIESMTGTGRFVCEICGKRLVDRRLYRDHMNKHTGYKPYMCQYCGRSFGWRGGLRAHVQACKIKHQEAMTDGPHIRPFPCPIEGCGKTFINNGRLQHHINGVHVKNMYPCKKCGTPFNYRHKRDVHQKKCFNDEIDNVPKIEEDTVTTSREDGVNMTSREYKSSITLRDNDVVMTSRYNDVMTSRDDDVAMTSPEAPLAVPSRLSERIDYPAGASGQFNYSAAVPNLPYQYVDPEQGFSWALFPH